MPVLATAATLTLLFLALRGGAGGSFLDPVVLRKSIDGKLSDGDSKDKALALADELVELAKTYRETADEALARYEEQVQTGKFSSESILELLGPLHEVRVVTLDGLARIRQAMLETLSDEEWSSIFD